MIWFALALAAGAALPLQAVVNARLGTGLGGPLWGALVSFVVGTLLLATALAARRSALPSVAALVGAPVWAWTGGLLGALVVWGVVAAVPKLGAATLVGLLVAGQVASSLALDASGMAPVQRGVGVQGILGALLIVAGVIVVARR